MTSNNRTVNNLALLVIPFLVAFIFGPLHQLNWLSLMPGDLGDARLNNYFLENIYQYLRGNSPSLIHLNFFSPFPYVLGFSDNLFGASAIYLVARVITGESDTAYQLWFLVGYIANYLAAYYALKLLKMSHVSAIFGALIFTFALPVVAQIGHAQLQYRFGVPLATAYFLMFLEDKNWRYFTIAMAWLTWQFYCTIYIGTFQLLLLGAMIIAFIAHQKIHNSLGVKDILNSFILTWRQMLLRQKIHKLLVIFTLLLLMGVLFYPYIEASMLYGFKRGFAQISTMLPRPISYFLADSSRIWSSNSSFFSDIPMRWEHQMFVGLFPLLLALFALLLKRRNYEHALACWVLSGAIALMILATLTFGNNVSLWILFYKLPLLSAMRAISRITLVFLFPLAFFCALGIEGLKLQDTFDSKKLILLIGTLMLFEFSAVTPYVTSKADWRERVAILDNKVPKTINNESILFFAQSRGPAYADEIDAMWVAMNHGASTLNGYSGNFPANYRSEFGADCNELPRRLMSFLDFHRKFDQATYERIMSQVIPIGFDNCNTAWAKNAPNITFGNRAYTKDTFKKLSIKFINKKEEGNAWVIDLKVGNDSNEIIHSGSTIGKPVRVSWRFLTNDGKPKTGWDTRQDLPFDINVNESINMKVLIDKNLAPHDGYIEFSLVQEEVFWAFDLGVTPARVEWSI